MGETEKKKARDFGIFAEQVIAEKYILDGYAILERNWRLGKTEIDLIAQKDNVIVIIEVKARSGKDENAVSAVNHDKRRRMVKAADVYIQRMKGDLEYRFDIATCTGNMDNHEIEIFKDAFLAADFF